jgi:hypothetical protein
MLANINPDVLQRMRQFWEAVDNAWTQRVLNYTQGEQLDLLKKLGFSAPTWQDLLRLLAGVIGVGALLAAVLTAVRRRRVDPWVRLLHQAWQRWQAAGVEAPAPGSPRQLAAAIAARPDVPPQARADWLAWLDAMEHARYARPAPAKPGKTNGGNGDGKLGALRARLRRLPAPRTSPRRSTRIRP